MKKRLLCVVFFASLSCSAIFAQPASSGGLTSLFAAKSVSSKHSQSACPLETIGNTLTTLMGVSLKPVVSLETSKSALSELNDLNNQYCSHSQITVANNPQGLTVVSGSGFTTYTCYSKDNAMIICDVLTSNYQVA